jgi:hypothetical protein
MMKRMVVLAMAMVMGVTAFAIPNAAAATRLTTEQRKELKYLIEEEKLARDVYTYLAENVTTQKFVNIAKSEQTHINRVAELLVTYNIKNPTTGMAVGEFQDPYLQGLYDKLIAQGAAGVPAALEVGVTIEKLDIADIQDMLKLKYPADVNLVLNRLLAGSKNHLASFSR